MRVYNRLSKRCEESGRVMSSGLADASTTSHAMGSEVDLAMCPNLHLAS